MKHFMRSLMTGMFLVAAGAGAHAAHLQVHVSGAAANGRLPQRFAYNRQGCHGANQRPGVHWSGAPARTRSFAVSVYDRDAGQHGFWHWIVIDLGVQTHSLAGDQMLPARARKLRNDYGHMGWGGPCPPPGAAHHYVFTVYALDVAHLPLAASTDPARAARIINAHALQKAHVTLTYGR